MAGSRGSMARKKKGVKGQAPKIQTSSQYSTEAKRLDASNRDYKGHRISTTCCGDFGFSKNVFHQGGWERKHASVVYVF